MKEIPRPVVLIVAVRHSKSLKSQTLLYVGVALFIIAMVVGVVMLSSVTSLKTRQQQRKSGDAYQLALAGIERAKVELTNDWDNWTMDVGDDNDPHRNEAGLDETESLGQGQFWVRVQDVVPVNPDQLQIISHGWLGDAQRIIEVVVERTADSLASGLIAHYPFDGNTDDLSGNGNNGTPYGVSYVAGQVGQAARFNGNDYVDLGAFTALDGVSEFTVSFWLYRNRNTFNSWAGLFSRGTVGPPEVRVPYIFGNINARNIYFQIFGSGCNFATSNIPRRVWTYLTFRWDGATCEAWINGSYDSGMPANPNPLGNSDGENWIGRLRRIPGGGPGTCNSCGTVKGRIDELKVWDRALTDTEINDLYQQLGAAGGSSLTVIPGTWRER